MNELRDGIGDVRWVMRLKERNNKQRYNRKLRQSKRQKVWSKLSINYLPFNKRYAILVTIPVTYRLMRKELFRFGWFRRTSKQRFYSGIEWKMTKKKEEKKRDDKTKKEK